MEKELIINLGSVHDIPVGQGKCFVIQGEEIAIFRSRSGKITAIENKCPHRQGPLADGIMGDGLIVCPLHGHKFDLKTGKGSEGHECVQVFMTKIKKNQIFLSYSEQFTFKRTQPRMSI